MNQEQPKGANTLLNEGALDDLLSVQEPMQNSL